MNKFSSIFGQLLTLFPRLEFESFVKKTKSACHTKGFSCWDQFVAMLFCQLGQAHSLREICGGLATALGKIRHLGLTKAPSRSTLAYANEHRPWQLYEQLFYQLLSRCHSQFGGKHKFRFKNKLVSFDASVIAMCLSVFDWAKYRRTKGAIKLHLLLDHAGYLPQFVNITEGRVHEIKILKKVSFDAGTIVAIDRGLVDYELFGQWTRNGIHFVTPLKSNADYQVVKNNPVPKNRNILKDQLIRLNGFYSKDKCPYLLRLVEVWIEEKQASLVLLTNQMQFGATTIAAIYKDRWQIELFFKALKQNLRIKTFVGTSPNAVMIQIWTALIAILILKYLQSKAKINWSLSNLVAMLRFNLLTYKDLWHWLDHPYYSPPLEQEVVQMSLLC
ncbi:MAG: IS4 family transposase [bacterium]|jgi:hypothetical protein|nr:IS4 family transposase [bacterium]